MWLQVSGLREFSSGSGFEGVECTAETGSGAKV